LQAQPKRKKKNKALPLLLLIAVMCILGAAYLMLSAANDRKAAEEAAAAAESSVIMLAEFDAASITELKFRTGDNGWISLTQSGGVWSLTDDSRFPMKQTAAAELANAIVSIGAIRKVAEGAEADYGLDEPACEIHVTYHGNTTYKYAIGDHNSFNNAYYFRDDDGAFYMIAPGLLSIFQKDLDNLIVLDAALATVDTADITKFTVTNGETSREIVQAVTEAETDTDGNTVTEASRNAEVSALYDLFCELNLLDWVDYHADSTEMAEEYGIDGSCSLRLDYKKSVELSTAAGQASTAKADAVYTVYFGNTEDGMTYYSPAGSSIVYAAADELVSEILVHLVEAAE